MLKLHFANRRYSSWSLRGWLAAKQSGLPFEPVLVDIYADDWAKKRETQPYKQGNGKVPLLEDGDLKIWNSMAIIEWLDKLGDGTRFWPKDPAARAFALSAAMEMQSSYVPLRQACPMNMMRHYPGWELPEEATKDVRRIEALWEQGLAEFGGPWLAGAEWGAVDIMFAPVVSRLTTYDVKLSEQADAYRQRVLAHPDVAEWIADAATETRIKDAYEF